MSNAIECHDVSYSPGADFEITDIGSELKRGTTIKIFLKEGENDYTQKWKLDSIIKKHSNFVSFPIILGGEKVP